MYIIFNGTFVFIIWKLRYSATFWKIANPYDRLDAK